MMSDAAQPKVRSAAGLNRVTVPCASMPTIASRAPSKTASCRATASAIASVAARSVVMSVEMPQTAYGVPAGSFSGNFTVRIRRRPAGVWIVDSDSTVRRETSTSRSVSRTRRASSGGKNASLW